MDTGYSRVGAVSHAQIDGRDSLVITVDEFDRQVPMLRVSMESLCDLLAKKDRQISEQTALGVKVKKRLAELQADYIDIVKELAKRGSPQQSELRFEALREMPAEVREKARPAAAAPDPTPELAEPSPLVDAERASCKACKKPIVFAISPALRELPVDPDPVDLGDYTIGAPAPWHGGPMRPTLQKVAKGGVVSVPRFQSHYKSCTDPGRFSRGRSGARA